jgi:hypothetical protein
MILFGKKICSSIMDGERVGGEPERFPKALQAIKKSQ